MRISDWSSDVCSSDLSPDERALYLAAALGPGVSGTALRHGADLIQTNRRVGLAFESAVREADNLGAARRIDSPSGTARQDRKSGVTGKSVSVRVGLGGRRNIKKQDQTTKTSVY